MNMNLIWALGLFFFTFVLLLLLIFKLTKPRSAKHISLDKNRSVEISDHKINYYQAGRGEDLLLIHGLGSSSICWEDIFPKLIKKYRVTAIDLPGFGLSDKHPELEYGFNEQISRLREFCDKLDIHQCHIIGCSMGGTLGIGMAIEHSDIVKSLTLISPAIQPRLAMKAPKRALWFIKTFGHRLVHPSLINQMARNVFINPTKIEPQYLEHYYSVYLDAPDAVSCFWKAIDTIREFPYNQSLAKIACPTMLLFGEKDRVTPWRSLKTMQKQISDLKVFKSSKGGHHLMEDEPDFVIEKLELFFGTT